MHIFDSQGRIEANFRDPAVWASPYDVFDQLRRLDGLARVRQPLQGEAWIAARYDDAVHVLKQTDIFRNDSRNAGVPRPLDYRWAPKILRSFSHTMILSDGVDHRRLRRLANKAFTPQRVVELTQHIEAITRELLEEATRGDTFDLMSAFALPLPLRIISEMLGVEEPLRLEFHAMLKKVLIFSTPWKFLLHVPTLFSLYRFFERLLERKRLVPGDDLTSALVLAEEEGDRLTAEELVGTVYLLLFAGHETTVNLIGNGTLALLDNPDQLERLRADRALLPSAVEEMLRYHSPATQTSPRYVAVDCELSGVRIKRGESVMVMVSAANRDPGTFHDAERFDVGRDPNPHIAFGAGPHFCIGAHLSRLEARIAFDALLSRLGTLTLAVPREKVRWRPEQAGLRGLAALPLRVR